MELLYINTNKELKTVAIGDLSLTNPFVVVMEEKHFIVGAVKGGKIYALNMPGNDDFFTPKEVLAMHNRYDINFLTKSDFHPQGRKLNLVGVQLCEVSTAVNCELLDIPLTTLKFTVDSADIVKDYTHPASGITLDLFIDDVSTNQRVLTTVDISQTLGVVDLTELIKNGTINLGCELYWWFQSDICRPHNNEDRALFINNYGDNVVIDTYIDPSVPPPPV